MYTRPTEKDMDTGYGYVRLSVEYLCVLLTPFSKLRKVPSKIWQKLQKALYLII